MTSRINSPRRVVSNATDLGAPRDQAIVTEFSSGMGTITLANLPAISFQGRAPFSVELWLYLDALIDKATLVSRTGEFVLESRGSTLFAMRASQIVPLTSGPILEEHVWYHIAVTFDGITMSLYVNGMRRDFVTATDPGVPNGGQPFVIGGGLYGQIDSVRLWNKAVPPGSIYQYQWPDYPAGTANLIAQIDCAVWPPVDTSGGKVPVTVSNTGVRKLLYTPAATMAGQSFIDPYNDEALNPGGTAQDFSVMAWINPHLLPAVGYVFSNNPIGQAGCSVSVGADGKVSFQIGAATPVVSGNALVLEQWVNVTCTWLAATGAAVIYLNGFESGAGTMALTQTGTSGAPLIGASASTQSALPVSSFIGSIQSVSLWNRVLSSADVIQYMTGDPINDPTCIADYDFIPPRPQNSLSLNPVGLVGEVEVHQIATIQPPSAVQGSEPAAGHGHSDDTHRRGGGPAGAHQFEGFVPSHVRPQDFSAERRAAWAAEFRAFLADQLGLSAQEQAEFTAKLEENLAHGARAVEEGTARVPYHTTFEHLDNGDIRVLLHGPEGTSVMFEGVMTDCTAWVIQFIIAVGSTIWTVFGFYLNLSRVSQGLTNYLGQRINNIGLLPQLQAVFNSGVSPTSVYNALNLLYSFGLLTGMAKFFWQAVTSSISIWTIVSLGGRLVLLFSPFAPLEIALFITELGLALVNVYNVWNDPANCWKSTVRLAAAAG